MNQEESVGENSVKSITQENEYVKGEDWTPDVEIYVKNISKKCIMFRNIHEESAIYYENLFNVFSIVLILLSFISSCLTIIKLESIVYSYITTLFTLLVSTSATVNKFLKWQEYSTRHRIGANKFLELNESISSQMLTRTSERINGIKYIKWAAKVFIQTRKTLPFPPNSILKKLNIDSDDDDPEISFQQDLETGILRTQVPKFTT